MFAPFFMLLLYLDNFVPTTKARRTTMSFFFLRSLYSFWIWKIWMWTLWICLAFSTDATVTTVSDTSIFLRPSKMDVLGTTTSSSPQYTSSSPQFYIQVSLSIEAYRNQVFLHPQDSTSLHRAAEEFFQQVNKDLYPHVIEQLQTHQTQWKQKPIFNVSFTIDGQETFALHYVNGNILQEAEECIERLGISFYEHAGAAIRDKAIYKVANELQKRIRKAQKNEIFRIPLEPFNKELIHYAGWTSHETVHAFIEEQEEQQSNTLKLLEYQLTTLIDKKLDEKLQKDQPIDFFPKEKVDEITIQNKDLQDLVKIQEACLQNPNQVVSWNSNDKEETIEIFDDQTKMPAELYETLAKCPPIEVYLPNSIRVPGYCEDAAAYLMFLNTRGLPLWVFELKFQVANEKTVTYMDLCPHTPLIVFNHHVDDLLDAVPSIFVKRPLYLMPNIEMFELTPQHLWTADTVLCKTLECTRRIQKWYQQEGKMHETTRVLYTGHTSSDPTSLSSSPTPSKDFENLSFVHTPGKSPFKGTQHIIDCWLTRDDGLPLDIYMTSSLYEEAYAKKFTQDQLKNASIQLHVGYLDSSSFGQVLANASVLLCPSHFEGYGHYVNQARAAGALIVSTDAPPMNELIRHQDNGILVEIVKTYSPYQLLGGNARATHGLKDVSGLAARFNPQRLCHAIDEIVYQMDATSRQKLASKARKTYIEDMKYFAYAMQQLTHDLKKI